jgi:hypothetical protein
MSFGCGSGFGYNRTRRGSMEMADGSESKRLWRTAGIVAGLGLVVLIPLAWLAVRMYNDTLQRRVVAANEGGALYTLELISAAEQIHLQNYGQYGTLQQLTDSGILQMTFGGDPPSAAGYAYRVRLTPKTDASAPAYSVNADPVRAGGRDATGRRHFYISSEVIGIRISEDRPAAASDPPRLAVQE